MDDTKTRFQPFNLRSASDHEYECLAEFKNILNKEYYPDDPPIPLEEQLQGWKNIPEFVEIRAYAGWNSAGTNIIAYGEMEVEHTEDNQHIAYFGLEVLPEYRCRGLGHQMLEMLLPFATEHHRKLLIVWVNNRIPASTIFVEQIGARKGQEAKTNQLIVSDFDRALMQEWLRRSENLKRDFEIGFWDGAYPEEDLAEITALFEKLANDQPRDDLEMEDWKVTPEMIRQFEQYMFARGTQRWTMYLTDRATGKKVGLTEVRWNSNRPAILNQGFTAIDPTYRNRGLGRWLKATMMERILQQHPEVQFIRTGNANSNAPMLKINNEMGFKPYFAMTIWQVDIAQVEKHLHERTNTS